MCCLPCLQQISSTDDTSLWSLSYSGWTVEYTGYLMSEHYIHSKATLNVLTAESIPGSYMYANTDGGLFYYVEAMYL